MVDVHVCILWCPFAFSASSGMHFQSRRMNALPLFGAREPVTSMASAVVRARQCSVYCSTARVLLAHLLTHDHSGIEHF